MPRNPKDKKFTVGRFIDVPTEVLECVRLGRWIWFGTDRHARVYAASWIANMNFACVMNYIARKQLAFAVRNPDYPYVFRARLMETHVHDKSSEWWVTCSEIPDAKITEFTKDSAINSACKAAMAHAGCDVKVHVVFEVPEHKTKVAKLLT